MPLRGIRGRRNLCMDSIQALFHIDFSYVFLSVFLILTGIKTILSLLEWMTEKLGFETKWMRRKKEERRLLKQTADNLLSLQHQQKIDRKISTEYDEMIEKDLSQLSHTVNGIVLTLEEMQRKSNETELKRLKDSLVQYYNQYKTIGEWSKLEKDAFWDLFDDYESRGGDGYIHGIVEPVMRELKETNTL